MIASADSNGGSTGSSGILGEPASSALLYRRLRGLAPDARLVGIVSCRHGEGASTVARQLAGQAARAGEATLLVTDDRLELGGHGTAGEETAASGGRTPGGPSLEISPWKKLGLDPPPDKLPDGDPLLAELRERFCLTLLDLAPLETDEPWRLAPALDGLVVVIGAGRSPAREVRATLKRLQRHAKVLGLVLNGCDR